MANVKRDENRTPGLLAETNDSNRTPTPLTVTPVTGRLRVDAAITSGSSSGTEYTEGDTDASITGVAVLGEGTSDSLRPIKTDDDGHLQVDIVDGTVNSEIDGTALSNGQVTVDTTSGGVQIVAASAGRAGVIIKNQGSVDCYVGTGTVSTANSLLLEAGESISLTTDSEVKAITGSSSTTIGYLALA